MQSNFRFAVIAVCAGFASALRLPSSLHKPIISFTSATSAAAITFHSEAAHAKSIIGVNGGLDFGPLAGDQPGGEGTGKALGINDDSLLIVLGVVIGTVFFLFAQWQDKQDDDDDFFDVYDSRRVEN